MPNPDNTDLSKIESIARGLFTQPFVRNVVVRLGEDWRGDRAYFISVSIDEMRGNESSRQVGSRNGEDSFAAELADTAKVAQDEMLSVIPDVWPYVNFVTDESHAASR